MTDTIEDIYPQSNSLKAEDLKGRAVQAQISDYKVQDFDKGKKIVLTFHGKEKTFVVNKTNAMIIASAYGSSPENWIDEVIELYPDKTLFQKKLVDCIRVRLPVKAAEPIQKVDKGRLQDMDDDVPPF
jgi:hypothetical protein